MKQKILNLIHEQTSPLFRIMSVYNHDEPSRRKFENNITAFHIGNGLLLTVAHNLKLEAQLIKSIPEPAFQQSILSRCNENETALMNRCFFFDPATNRRYINITDQNDFNPSVDTLKRINFDTRWVSQYQANLCQPFLIIQFQTPTFFNNPQLTDIFPASNRFHEPSIESFTFLIPLQLVQAFYDHDIAVYRIIQTHPSIVSALPSAPTSFETFLPGHSLFCLQSSPSGTNLGRMLNQAHIEGILDHHAMQPDPVGGNFIRKGLRYLLKGYFRFGSSGAPYFIFDPPTQTFLATAIQSEASPIQLSIKNDKNGNFQYINAIASPLSLIQQPLLEIINTPPANT